MNNRRVRFAAACKRNYAIYIKSYYCLFSGPSFFLAPQLISSNSPVFYLFEYFLYRIDCCRQSFILRLPRKIYLDVVAVFIEHISFFLRSLRSFVHSIIKVLIILYKVSLCPRINTRAVAVADIFGCRGSGFTQKNLGISTEVLAAGEGFEPSLTESESGVLPLHQPALSTLDHYIKPG